MTLYEKHGFTAQWAAPDSAAVQYYWNDHLTHYGYPADTKSSSVMWLGICRDEKVWGVIGINPLGEVGGRKSVEVPDFLFRRDRWGIIAAYAGLEIVRDLSKSLGIEIITATPVWNTVQMRAQEKVFGVSGPTHHLYRYRPWEEKVD